MSEVIKTQPLLFENGDQPEPLGEYDNNQEFVDFYLSLAEKFHLDPELARLGAMWGIDWWEAVQAGEQWSDQDIEYAKDRAAESLPIPKDSTENRPTFRVEFIANETFDALELAHNDKYCKIPEQGRVRIIPNFEQIDKVFSTLLDSYNRKLYPYNLDSTRVPQDPRHMPRNLETDIEKCDEKQKI